MPDTKKFANVLRLHAQKYLETYGAEYQKDVDDLNMVAHHIEVDNLSAARLAVRNLDTIVRDAIPNTVWTFLYPKR